LQEIKENNYDLSINRYKEFEYIPPKYDKPEVILEKLKSIEKEIVLDFDKLMELDYKNDKAKN
jgi:type I restriction enzyme M protein